MLQMNALLSSSVTTFSTEELSETDSPTVMAIYFTVNIKCALALLGLFTNITISAYFLLPLRILGDSLTFPVQP